MKNIFKPIWKGLKWTGKAVALGASSPLIREIAAASFTAAGLPTVGRAIRVVDSAITGGTTWEEIKRGLIERAVKEPSEAQILLALINQVENQIRPRPDNT